MWAEKNNRAIKFLTARPTGFRGRRRFTEPTPSFKTQVGRAVGCLNDKVKFPAHMNQ